MKNYSEMSDFEINKAVAKGLKLRVCSEQSASLKINPSSVLCANFVHGNGTTYEFNPCNDWADIGAIICDNEIDLTSPTSGGIEQWMASKFYPDKVYGVIDALDKNPKRAAAICFLMMEQSQ